MKPVLYIFMPNDVKSMNPGKKMAQAAHAANAFVDQVNDIYYYTNDLIFKKAYERWMNETKQGFGTTIVLQVNHKHLIHHINAINRIWVHDNMYFIHKVDLIHGIITDPTYPIDDEGAVHIVEFNTCGYVFIEDVDNSEDPCCAYIKEKFELHE